MVWKVDLSTECGGRFEHFLFEKQAVKYAHENWEYPYITLQHNSNNSIRIKDNPQKKKGDKNCVHHWFGEFGGIRCEKCEAIVNIACNHTGSFGCIPCSQGYADDINNGKYPQPALHNLRENICQVCGLLNDEHGRCSNEYCKSKEEKQ